METVQHLVTGDWPRLKDLDVSFCGLRGEGVMCVTEETVATPYEAGSAQRRVL